MSINAHEVATARNQIKAICEQMKAGTESFIEGSRLIIRLASVAAMDDDDPDLVVFVAIESETDDVPSGNVLEYWNDEAIKKLTPRWEQAESWAKSYGTPACRKIIARF